MTKPTVIIIQGNSLESFYDQTIDYLHAKYHNYPAPPKVHMDSRTASEMGCHERMAESIKAQKAQGVPKGKIVV